MLYHRALLQGRVYSHILQHKMCQQMLPIKTCIPATLFTKVRPKVFKVSHWEFIILSPPAVNGSDWVMGRTAHQTFLAHLGCLLLCSKQRHKRGFYYGCYALLWLQTPSSITYLFLKQTSSATRSETKFLKSFPSLQRKNKQTMSPVFPKNPDLRAGLIMWMCKKLRMKPDMSGEAQAESPAPLTPQACLGTMQLLTFFHRQIQDIPQDPRLLRHFFQDALLDNLGYTGWAQFLKHNMLILAAGTKAASSTRWKRVCSWNQIPVIYEKTQLLSKGLSAHHGMDESFWVQSCSAEQDEWITVCWHRLAGTWFSATLSTYNCTADQ